MKRLSILGRWMATTLFCLSAIAFAWQGALFAHNPAIAAPMNLVASADKEAVSEGFDDAKDFIDSAKNKVKRTANQNAARVDRATDNDSLVEGKAKRDRDRIEQRAETDAARTKRAVDDTKNVVESAIDNIKDTFSN